MADFWKIKRPKEVPNREKPIHVDVGITIMTGIGQNGQPFLKYIDERTGQELWGYKVEPRGDSRQPSQPQPSREPSDRGSHAAPGPGYGAPPEHANPPWPDPDDDLPF